MTHRAHVITVSDGVAAGTREDRSGPALKAMLEEAGYEVSGPQVIPDAIEPIEAAIVAADADFVITTGGTGLGPRDVTPQATAGVIDYEVPGLGELMRSAGAASTPMSWISRGLAGVRGQTLVLNVPGSGKGATESLQAVLPVLDHAMQLLHGNTAHG